MSNRAAAAARNKYFFLFGEFKVQLLCDGSNPTVDVNYCVHVYTHCHWLPLYTEVIRCTLKVGLIIAIDFD